MTDTEGRGIELQEIDSVEEGNHLSKGDKRAIRQSISLDRETKGKEKKKSSPKFSLREVSFDDSPRRLHVSENNTEMESPRQKITVWKNMFTAPHPSSSSSSILTESNGVFETVEFYSDEDD
ncbi:MAG: hypothetical protein ACTSUE_20055 [Promethearchaeota archaeon]